ncbi:VOC family protein [Microbacterium capsulatum]|uniref:VOC family protein n=1 Tax=Microbacterium capsulatum TaxID=3041921 RepID=A0ABU0XCI1_9MICO|nr:VOC family protein [Microbacterium sp. ASV81]MDQ4212822.1 VOC family protein [Microbacterium sp. ASV81]
MTVRRMDHVGLVVEDLDAAVAFFTALGLGAEGRTTVEGDWVDRIVGLTDVRSDIVMMRTPDGRSRIELSTFQRPVADSPAPWAPANVPGIPRLTFVVDDLQDTMDRLRPHGAELVGGIAQYLDLLLYCYVRGPAGVIVGLVEEFGASDQDARSNS